jgi:hypothetical protein
MADQAIQVNSTPLRFIRYYLLIHIEDNSSSYFLSPVGISDPREFIEAESRRIPFKAALSGPQLWQDAFKNWPLPPIAG